MTMTNQNVRSPRRELLKIQMVHGQRISPKMSISFGNQWRDLLKRQETNPSYNDIFDQLALIDDLNDRLTPMAN